MPRAFPELSSGDVLVMERFDGVSLSQAGPDLAGRGLDSSAIAGVLVGELLDEIMVDGIFHTDPHPGNILVLGDGSLGFIDFGSVGRLDRELRESLQRILFALDSQDVYSLSDGLLEVTTRPDDLDQVEFERALGGFMARFLNVAGQPDMRMFNELIRLVMKFRLSVPNELAAVFRSLGTIEGSATALDPRFDLVHHAKSYGEQYAQKLVDGDALRERVQSEMIAALPIAKRFVRRVDRIAGAVESGRLTVNIRLFADAKERNVVTSWLNQILLTVLAATTGVMGVLLIRVPDGPAMTSSIGLYDFAGFILLFISSVMALRVLVGIFAAGRHREDSY
ncbi:AarF/UbiB family protein [Salininema proteolyticum]|uniref:AarF/UbiB family protein n=1 Tax=Salininema proteolyticum TaxID=1607685 RepID=UPI0036429F33